MGAARIYADTNQTRSGCFADTWDCHFDGGSCTSDGSCSSDGGCSDTCGSDGGCSDTPSVSKPTDMGSLTLVGVTSSSITIRMSKIALAEYYEVAYRLTTTTEATYEESYDLTYTITGLSPGTTYLVNYRAVNDAGYGPHMSTALRATTLQEASSFEWTYAGLNSAGRPVGGAEKEAGYGIYVTADEWNELAGLVSDVTGESVSTVSSGDPISASVVNTMARALGVGTVSRSTVISASFFNELSSAYNALV